MNTIVLIVCSQVSILRVLNIPDTKDDLGSLPLIPLQFRLLPEQVERLGVNVLVWKPVGGEERVVCIKLGLSTSYTSPGIGEHMEPSSFLSSFLTICHALSV